MSLCYFENELQIGSIAVVSSASSRVWYQLQRIGFQFERFENYNSMRRYCEENKPTLIIVTQDDKVSKFAFQVLNESDSFGLLGIPILAIGDIQTENCILNLIAKGVGDVVSTEAVDVELIARIKALVHRSQSKQLVQGFYPYLFKLDTREIFYSDVPVDTTILEFNLALFLFSHPNVVHSREELLKRVWGISASIDSRRVDTHISRVRAKLQLDDRDKRWFLTSIYIRGYMLKETQSVRQ